MAAPQIKIARSASEMDHIAPLWNELVKLQAHTIFQRFSWNRLAANIFSDRLTPHIVAVESDAGAAIIPAAVNHATRQLELIGEALFDYRDVLHAGDSAVLDLAWRETAKCGRPLRVTAVSETAARERWREFSTSPFAKAPQVERSLVNESDFRVAHSRLGRQMRRLSRSSVSLYIYSGGNSEAIRRLYECKRRHFTEDNLFFDQRRCDFIVAAAALEGSGCELFTLDSKDGALVSGLLTFRDVDVRRFYTVYFDPEWARYSPGVALLYEVTALSLREGLSCDYMTGEQPYKLRLANASRALYKVEARAKKLAEIAAGRRRSVA